MPVITLYSGAALVPLFILLSVPGIVLAYSEKRLSVLWDNNVKRMLWVLCAWMAVSSTWSPDMARGLKLSFRVALLLGLGFLVYSVLRTLPLVEQRRMIRALLWGILLALVISLIEIFTSGDILRLFSGQNKIIMSDFNRGALMLSLLIWALASASPHYGGFTFCGLLFTLSITAVSLLENQTALLGIITGMALYAVALLIGARRAAMLAIGGIIAFSAVFPALFLYNTPNTLVTSISPYKLPASFEHRLNIWRYTVMVASEAPWFGHGMDASRHITTLERNPRPHPGVPMTGEGYTLSKNGENILQALHPHNATLQIWLELGLLGLLLSLALTIGAFLYAAAAGPTPLAFLGAFWATMQTGVGVWQSWYLCAGMLALILTLLASDHRRENAGQARP